MERSKAIKEMQQLAEHVRFYRSRCVVMQTPGAHNDFVKALNESRNRERLAMTQGHVCAARDLYCDSPIDCELPIKAPRVDGLFCSEKCKNDYLHECECLADAEIRELEMEGRD